MAVDDLGDREKEYRELRKIVERMMLSDTSRDGSHKGTGDGSIQIGDEAAATWNYAVALGAYAVASAYYAIAVGLSAEASASDGIAIGRSSEAAGASAIALGINAAALAQYAVAMGGNSEASGDDSTALGAWSFATDEWAVAIGRFATASHARSVALGPEAATNAADQIMLGNASHTVVVPGTFSNPSARRLKEKIEPAPCLRTIFPTLHEWQYINGDGHRHIAPIADELLGTDAERFLTYDAEGRIAGIETIALHTAQVAALHARLTALENTPLRKIARWFKTLVRRQHG
jgi:hypothetical protein